MTNPTAPLIPIELDKIRHLRFDFNSAARFEEMTGKNLFDGGVMGQMSATTLRAFLWSCLVHEDAELTLEQVGEMIHFGNINEVSEKLTEVYAKNTPKTDGKVRPLA